LAEQPGRHSRRMSTLGVDKRDSRIIPTDGSKPKGSAKSIPLKKVSPESAGPVTPWRPEHIRLLDRYVPNFKRYAEKQKAVAANDLVYWAILCGSFELAKELWKKCETPLRTAIIAQYMCSKIAHDPQLLVKELLVKELEELVHAIRRFELLDGQALHDLRPDVLGKRTVVGQI
ncbi:MAG: hypothetical protein VX007_10795, partial [Pseudomonadota bacterium]|nr:hypothetical protein [Pseudomonadota bacterium]